MKLCSDLVDETTRALTRIFEFTRLIIPLAERKQVEMYWSRTSKDTLQLELPFDYS